MTLMQAFPVILVGAVAFLALVARSHSLQSKTWVHGKRPDNLDAAKPNGREPSMEDLLETVRADIASKS